MNRSVWLIKFVFLFIIFIGFQGCSGGSPSSRKRHIEKKSENSLKVSTDRKTTNNKTPQKQNTLSKSKRIPLHELYNQLKKSVFIIYTSDGNHKYQGSGFFISKDGLAVSNYHVFEGTSKGSEIIETLDKQRFKIKEVLDKSKKNDYIIFRVNIGNYNITNPIPIASKTPQIGDDVFTIGNPRGLESTLSKGIISAFREDNSLIQTTAEITHGSSGGPLLNMRGEVIGITSAGFGEANLNFAINIRMLKLLYSDTPKQSNSDLKEFMLVTKVVDGDTFWVDNGSEKGLKIRLIGVNTPETMHPHKPVEHYGREASDYVKSILTGNKVRLEFDIKETDKYGRTLAYVYLKDGTFLNEEIIKKGYGYAETVPPNVKYSKKFIELERKAREQQIGLWKE